MTISIITDHIQQGLDLLKEQFKGKEKIEAFISAFLNQIQLIEDTLEQLLNDRTIDLSSGENLDLIGRIVGQPREGRTDANYRPWIKARILINKSSGTAEEIYEALRLILIDFPNFDMRLIDEYPAGFRLQAITALGSLDPDVIFDILNQMRAAAVDISFAYNVSEPIFKFDSGPGWDQGHLGGLIS